MGPTEALIAHVSAVGFRRYLEEQAAATPSEYPDLPAMPRDQQTGCPEGSPATCVRDNYSMYPLQVRFFQNALQGDDQLRQRVALALHEILVVSGVRLRQPSILGPYLNMLQRNALGSYRTLLADLTLSPAMGSYLDTVDNAAATPPANVPPDENYARELLQLFSVGVPLLAEDGRPALDGEGRPVPAYGQETIRSFARVFTGFTYATLPGAAASRSSSSRTSAAPSAPRATASSPPRRRRWGRTSGTRRRSSATSRPTTRPPTASRGRSSASSRRRPRSPG
jgi:uncharacterized protein (DUF1800 family)